MYADMDWVAMSLAQRIAPTKALYRAFAAVAKRHGIKRDLLLFEVLADSAPSGTDYFNNFCNGQMDQHKARDVHLWLAQNYFEVVNQREPDLFPHKPVDPFRTFVDRTAITGKLNIVRLKQQMGIVERADDVSTPAITLRLTERFCFEVDTALTGIALAFQHHKDTWHPLPLGADKRCTKADVRAGTNMLPRTADGHPIHPQENDDTGSHRFAVIISENKNLSEIMHLLATIDADDQAFEVHVTNVNVVT